jgi:hypothetical protein
VLLVVVGASSWLVGAAASGSEMVKGTYCPLPEPGHTPRCLGAAQAEYGEFFAALDAGALDDAAAARVEADLLSGERAHLALSSLAFGYYQLARSVASEPSAHPDFVARLEHWNALLAETYQEEVPLRGVVREAAADLEARAPPVPLACTDGSEHCTTTSGLSGALAAVDAAAGIRGPLVRLWQRWLGGARRAR